MKTNEEIRKHFEVGADLAELLVEIQQIGYEHGEMGWYPNQDFGSDADWCYGVGAKITCVEVLLKIDDDSVFRLYTEAHGEGLTGYEEKNA